MFINLLVLFLCILSRGDFIQGDDTSSPFSSASNSIQCPDPGDIYPCICTVEALAINMDCSGVVSEDQLKDVFSQNFTGIDAIKLTIKDTDLLTTLHNGVFGNTQFIEVDIEGTNINMVETGAFSASYSTATKLKFKDNKIISFPFAEMEKFTNLTQLDLTSNLLQNFPTLKSNTIKDFFVGSNLIKIIPEQSFKYLPQLQRFRAGRNEIMEIRRGTFSSLKFLQEVDYTSNQISTILKNTFLFNGTFTSLYLSSNTISTVQQSAFTGVTNEVNMATNSLRVLDENVWRPLLENEARLAITENPLHCDCNIAWLVRNATFLGQVYKGATCDDGILIHEIDPSFFDYCFQSTTATIIY